MSKPLFQQEFEDDSLSRKLSRKAKDSPFMIAGLAGLVIVCGVGIYKFKRRGEMSPSVFLMQYRVAAQGTVVGALSIGLAYSMAQRFVLNKDANAPFAAITVDKK